MHGTEQQMLFILCAVLLFLPQLLVCSILDPETQPKKNNYRPLELTPQLLGTFGTFLEEGICDVFGDDEDQVDIDHLRESCRARLISAAAAFKRTEHVLSATGPKVSSGHAVDLVEAASLERDCDTAVKPIIQIATKHKFYPEYVSLINELVKDNWNIMKKLFTRALIVSESTQIRDLLCRAFLGGLPLGRVYAIIRSEGVPLDTIDLLYPVHKPNRRLRELFFAARLSCPPSDRIREYIVEKVPCYGQFLSTTPFVEPDERAKSIQAIPKDILHMIFVLLDAETLLVALPLVCREWRKSYYPKFLRESTKLHDLFISDVNESYADIEEAMPWKICLRMSHLDSIETKSAECREEPPKVADCTNGVNAHEYLVICLLSGAMSRLEDKSYGLSRTPVEDCLKRVTEGKIRLLTTEDYKSACDAFKCLLKLAYSFRNQPEDLGVRFEKPQFLDDDDYDEAVEWLLQETKYLPLLPKTYIAKNMPKIFEMVNRDKDRMRDLVGRALPYFEDTSALLLMYGQQEGQVSHELAQTIFSKVQICEIFIGTAENPIDPNDYYRMMIRSPVFVNLAVGRHLELLHCQLIVSFILHFKGSEEAIEEIISSICQRVSDLETEAKSRARARARREQSDSKQSKEIINYVKVAIAGFESMINSVLNNRYPEEDIEFVKGIMQRLGWSRISKI